MRRLAALSLVVSFSILLAVPAGAADEEVVVPDVTGKPVAEALQTLGDAGLTARVVEIAGPAAGVVERQDPPGGARAFADSEIVLRVGTAARIPTEVPSVVGRPLDDVADELENLYVLEVTFAPGPAEQAGQVVSQQPAAGASLLYRGVLRLTVVEGGEDTGPAGVLVPPLVGRTETEAQSVLRGVGLRASVAYVKDANVAPGKVVSQDPPSGAEILAGGTVFLRVTQAPGATPEPQTATVPLTIGLMMGDAEAAVLGAGLVPRIRYQTTADYPAWSCIGQDPRAGEQVEDGSMVTLDIARSAAQPAEVLVPTVIGSNVAIAEEMLVASRLVPVAEGVPSNLPAGQVFEQDPAAGTRVQAGSQVRLRVAEPPPSTWTPQTVPVPVLVGLPSGTALRRLMDSGLRGRVRYRPAPNQPVDVVEDQDPPPGTAVVRGTQVRIYLPEQTTMPDLIGHTRETAIALLQAAGLNAAPRGPSYGVGTTRVSSQELGADEPVATGSTVGFYYVFGGGLGPVYTMVTVPNVVGMSRTLARSTLQARGLLCACQGPAFGRGKTVVTSQSPPAGTLVRRGSTVQAIYTYGATMRPGPKPGPVPGPVPGPKPAVTVSVPRVVGLPRGTASARLSSVGLRGIFEGPPGGRGKPYVLSQSPAPGTRVARGTTVRMRIVWRR